MIGLGCNENAIGLKELIEFEGYAQQFKLEMTRTRLKEVAQPWRCDEAGGGGCPCLFGDMIRDINMICATRYVF